MDKRLDALLKGYAQGGSFGFADEASGAVGAGMDKLMGLSDQNQKLKDQGFTGDIGPTSTSEVYTKDRDQYRDALDKLSKEHPNYYHAGELVGGASTSLPGAGSMLKAGTLGAAKFGALAGGLNGVGNSNASDPLEVAADGAVGGVAGGLTGAVLSKGAEGLFNAAQAAKRKFILPAQNARSLATTQNIFDKIKANRIHAEDTGAGKLLYDHKDPDYQHFIKQLADEDLVKEQQAIGKQLSEQMPDLYKPGADEATKVTNEQESNSLQNAMKKLGR